MTNYPEHPQSAIFPAPSSGNRPLAAALINAEDRQPSGHLIRIARHVSSLRSLPSQLLAEHVGPGGILPRCFPGLFPQSIQDSLAEVISVPFQSHKDIRDWQAQMHPVVLKVVGRRTRIRCHRTSPVKGSLFSISLLISRVIHELESLMEKGGNHGKAFGVFGNERRSSSVRNPSEADSAGGPLPISGRANPSRF